MKSIGDKWSRLDEAIPRGEALNAVLVEPDRTKRLYAAIDSRSRRHLLIKLASDEQALTDKSSRGLEVTTRELALMDEEPARYMDLMCNDLGSYPILDLISGELQEQLRSDDKPPAEAVKQIMAKWRRFWGRIRQSILSKEEQIGLFAELWFLLKWVLPSHGPKSVECWRGPWKHRHDFVFHDKSVEVKGTLGSTSTDHEIHGLEQLEADDNGHLYLLVVRLKEGDGEDYSLQELISNCYTELENDYDALSVFENSLLQSGYSPLHEAEYSSVRLGMTEELLYSVKDDFPRLSPSSSDLRIPPGVKRIRYSINLQGFESLIEAKGPAEWITDVEREE